MSTHPTTVRPAASPPRGDEPLESMLQLAQLACRVERLTPGDGEHATAVAGLTLLRLSAPCAPIVALHRPALCVIVQGAKRLMLADESYAYDPSTYLVVAQDLPVLAQVTTASAQAPYLCVRIDFDPTELARCALDWAGAVASRPAAADGPDGDVDRGLFVDAVDARLLESVSRLVRLAETPADIAALAPMMVREIVYRLLSGSQGWRLARFAHDGSPARRIASAIGWLREHYAEPLRIEDLAGVARMSPSSLHHRFKAACAMSPLQYQKRLRLIEARRLMLGERIDAADAAHRVGYQSPSQFSREYARLFGASPVRDLKQLRERRDPPQPRG